MGGEKGTLHGGVKEGKKKERGKGDEVGRGGGGVMMSWVLPSDATLRKRETEQELGELGAGSWEGARYKDTRPVPVRGCGASKTDLIRSAKGACPACGPVGPEASAGRTSAALISAAENFPSNFQTLQLLSAIFSCSSCPINGTNRGGGVAVSRPRLTVTHARRKSAGSRNADLITLTRPSPTLPLSQDVTNILMMDHAFRDLFLD